MLRFYYIFIISLFFSQPIYSQDVTATNDIQPGNVENEFNIKTTISGLIGVDIARIKYFIDNKHTYQPSPNNPLFSDRNENYIKFYIMAVPASGIINVELGIILGDNGEYSFPVEFQYSRNEEKQVLNLSEIKLQGNAIVASVENTPTPPIVIEEESTTKTPEPTPPIIEEEIVVETPEPTPIVEEDPVVEIPEPTPTVIEETVAETPEPTPVIEEEPIVETPAPASVIEEEPIIETPEPTPVIEETIVETPPATLSNKVASKYTVQLLSLLEFSQARLNIYCKQHNIPLSKIKKNKKGEWMKITYGEANSIEEANQIKSKLLNDHHISEAFVVPMN